MNHQSRNRKKTNKPHNAQNRENNSARAPQPSPPLSPPQQHNQQQSSQNQAPLIPFSSTSSDFPETVSSPFLNEYSTEPFSLVLGNLIGQFVQVRLKDGRTFEGLLHTISPGGGSNATDKLNKQNNPQHQKGLRIVLKYAQQKTAYSPDQLVPPVSETLSFSASEFAYLSALSATFLDDVPGFRHLEKEESFKVDTEISRNFEARHRELQPWIADSGDDLLESLEGTTNTGVKPNANGPLNNGNNSSSTSSTASSGSAGSSNWDQFAVNEKLFGVKSTYKEELYTTELDRSSPHFHEQMKEAAKIASEIERTPTRNYHLAEERGVSKPAEELDEEERYGAVIRKYVPPSKRSTVKSQGSTTSLPTTSSTPTTPSTSSTSVSSLASAIPAATSAPSSSLQPPSSSSSQPSSSSSSSSLSSASPSSTVSGSPSQQRAPNPSTSSQPSHQLKSSTERLAFQPKTDKQPESPHEVPENKSLPSKEKEYVKVATTSQPASSSISTPSQPSSSSPAPLASGSASSVVSSGRTSVTSQTQAKQPTVPLSSPTTPPPATSTSSSSGQISNPSSSLTTPSAGPGVSMSSSTITPGSASANSTTSTTPSNATIPMLPATTASATQPQPGSSTSSSATASLDSAGLNNSSGSTTTLSSPTSPSSTTSPSPASPPPGDKPSKSKLNPNAKEFKPREKRATVQEEYESGYSYMHQHEQIEPMGHHNWYRVPNYEEGYGAPPLIRHPVTSAATPPASLAPNQNLYVPYPPGPTYPDSHMNYAAPVIFSPHLRTYPASLQPSQTPTYVYTAQQYGQPVYPSVATSPTLPKRYFHPGANVNAAGVPLGAGVVGANTAPTPLTAGPSTSGAAVPNPNSPTPTTAQQGSRPPLVLEHHHPQTLGVAGVYAYSAPAYGTAQSSGPYMPRFHHPQQSKHHHHQHELDGAVQYPYVDSNDGGQR